MIAPPLTITPSEIDELVDLLERSLRDLAEEIAAKGLAVSS